MHPKDIQIADYSYELPDHKIAKYPLEKRDQSKLLVYENDTFINAHFYELENFVTENSMLVYNQTKVVHARLFFQKETGAKIEVFCLEPDERYIDVQTAMWTKGEVYWKCLLGGASKWKEGQIIFLENEDLKLYATKIEFKDGAWILKLKWTNSDLSFAEVLQRVGKVPLPPYMNRMATKEDEANYQTIFAKEEGSVAAPTASLHFTPQLLDSLKNKHINFAKVTLHVGAGTFKPVKAETMEGHDMHAEWMEVDIDEVERIKSQLLQNLPIIPIGTTSCRTLESLYWIGLQLINGMEIYDGSIAVNQWLPYENTFASVAPALALQAIIDDLKKKQSNKLIVRTQIIIAPSYSFKIIAGLVTNFHQPESTLLLLVAALIGENWKELYHHAMNHDYRFLSYGDGCLLWKKTNVAKV